MTGLGINIRAPQANVDTHKPKVYIRTNEEKG